MAAASVANRNDIICKGSTPRYDTASSIIKHKVWVLGGCNEDDIELDDIFELTMHSLTWTHIRTVQLCPQARTWCTLTALANNQLVLHGGFGGDTYTVLSDTWIMDLTSYSWKQYESRTDHTRSGHTGSLCLNNNVIIIGGYVSITNPDGFQSDSDYQHESYI